MRGIRERSRRKFNIPKLREFNIRIRSYVIPSVVNPAAENLIRRINIGLINLMMSIPSFFTYSHKFSAIANTGETKCFK